MEIRRIAQSPQTPFIDLMGDCSRWETDVLDHGMVALVDCMPRLVPRGCTADAAILQAARVSYGDGTKSISEDHTLLRYLMRHKHTSPFEMVEFKFHCVMPIFVARQWVRHRTANINEYSARYSNVKDVFYVPTSNNVRAQSNSNKQATDAQVDEFTAQQFSEKLGKLCNDAYAEYVTALTSGICREQARMLLPINVYTEWYWKCDLHNILNFLRLRLDPHAQYEIRVYAEAMHAMIERIAPVTCSAFNDYVLEAVTFTKPELGWLHGDRPPIPETREYREFLNQRLRAGL